MACISATVNAVPCGNFDDSQIHRGDTGASKSTTGSIAIASARHVGTSPKENVERMEWVMVVPPQFTKSAYATLVATQCVPRPWHLEGRYGSRTHPYVANTDVCTGTTITSDATVDTTVTLDLTKPIQNEKCRNKMCIPVISASVVETAAAVFRYYDDKDDDNNIISNSNDKILRRDLWVLLHETPGVELVYTDFVESKRAHEPPDVDARIHPERAPLSVDSFDETVIFQTSELPTSPSVGIKTPRNDVASFTYAELFAGIGGFGVALEALGGKCVFVSEIEESCRDVYLANFSLSPQIVHGDIYQVDERDLPVSLDLLVGGFPCQPFSAMGEQPGLSCPKGHLFLEIVRVLSVSRPLAFILENVPGLLQLPETLQIIVQALEDVGYDLTMEVCDARGLTATSRKRLFIVGFRRKQKSATNVGDDVSVDQLVKSETTGFYFPYMPDLGFRARDVLSYDPLSVEEEDLLRVTNAQLDRLNREKYWRPAHLAWPNVVIDTLVSHYGTSVARGHTQLVPASCNTKAISASTLHSGNPRRFTPRECARIMGFPATFAIPDKQNEGQDDMARTKELYSMFGNAVCPPVIAAIAGAVLDRCPEIISYRDHKDWVAWGRKTAVRLAYEATLTSNPILQSD